MASYTRRVKEVLTRHGCYFDRHGKGDHEIWYSPINGRKFPVDQKILSRSLANVILRAGGDH